MYGVKRRESSVESPASRLQSSESSVQIPTFRIQRPEYSVLGLESSVQSPTSRIQRPGSSVQLLPPQFRNSGMPIFLVLNLYSNNLLICLLFKSLKIAHLYLIKSNCFICSYIPNCSFFNVLCLTYKKTHLGLMDHPLKG